MVEFIIEIWGTIADIVVDIWVNKILARLKKKS